MKRKTVLCLLLHLAVNCAAQNYIDIARFQYSTTPLNRFENSSSSTRLKELGLDVTLPIVINSSDAFLTGLICERMQTKLFEGGPIETFSSVGVRIGLSKKYSERWSGTYLLIPKLASDFSNVTRRDAQTGAIAMMKYTRSENLNYKFGMYYNSELFGPFVVPLFGFYRLSADKKFEANLTLPFMVDLNYRLHNRLNIGVNFLGQVRSYHLGNVEVTNSGGYVVKTTNDIFGYLKFNLSKGLSIQTKVGYSLGRSYRVYDDAERITMGSILVRIGDNRQQLNTDFSNGLIFQTSLSYRFVKD